MRRRCTCAACSYICAARRNSHTRRAARARHASRIMEAASLRRASAALMPRSRIRRGEPISGDDALAMLHASVSSAARRAHCVCAAADGGWYDGGGWYEGSGVGLPRLAASARTAAQRALRWRHAPRMTVLAAACLAS